MLNIKAIKERYICLGFFLEFKSHVCAIIFQEDNLLVINYGKSYTITEFFKTYKIADIIEITMIMAKQAKPVRAESSLESAVRQLVYSGFADAKDAPAESDLVKKKKHISIYRRQMGDDDRRQCFDSTLRMRTRRHLIQILCSKLILPRYCVWRNDEKLSHRVV